MSTKTSPWRCCWLKRSMKPWSHCFVDSYVRLPLQLQWNVYFQPISYDTSGTHVQFIAGNSYVSEMQLWFVTVSINELDQCAVWDTTRRLDSVHEWRFSWYLIKSWEWWYWWNTDWFGVKTEDWRLLLSILIVRYKCCENVVVFLAFRYVALTYGLGGCGLLTSLVATRPTDWSLRAVYLCTKNIQ